MPTFGCVKVYIDVKIDSILKRKLLATLQDVVETEAEKVADNFIRDNPALKVAVYFVFQPYSFPIIPSK